MEPTDYLNLAGLHNLGRRLTAAAAAAMKDTSDLGTTELLLLECLYTDGAQPVGALARRTGFAQSRVSTVLAALRRRGLVDLAPDPADRRRTLAEIAPHARAQAGQARNRDAEPTLRALLAALPRADADKVISALGTLDAALGDNQPDPADPAP
ncbi:MarR family transcriptional regulator [Embleya sp. NBC_00896]|uniref:MarR family winged helix-turn-helix transcriptional regulator n=1 Tax=Embleya sp. NBC_00896 TaxID=2975961 RepID=UPI002F907906|nr:MarR family transcriptional regulator [Embleya sp. NBC_00896]